MLLFQLEILVFRIIIMFINGLRNSIFNDPKFILEQNYQIEFGVA